MATLNVTNLQNVASTVTNVSLLNDGTTTLVLNATGTSRTGGIRYNAGTLELYDGANWVAVGGGGGTAATLAEAAAGTLNTVFSSPLTAVPKDASGMTGAAILPSGTTAQRPATPVAGMTRLNTDTLPQLEQYAGGSWQPIGVITSNLTLNVATTGNDTTGLGTVAAPWATPHKAMEYLSAFVIKDGVTVTVSVADGTYTFTTPLNLNHPNGSQIFINGGTTSGARPTTTLTGGNAVGNTGATLAANDTLLNAYYNTKWQFNGCHGLVCDTGGNVTVNTVLIRGNATSPWSGVLAGNYNASATYASSGGITLGSTVAVHNFGVAGVAVTYGGSIIANDVTATNCGQNGISTGIGGSILASNCVSSNNGNNGLITNYGGSLSAPGATSRYNSGVGVVTIFGGSIQVTSATVTNNGGNGIATNYGGSISATSATASNNGATGILTFYGGSINAASATASNNGGYGILANTVGSINATSATANSNTISGISAAGVASVSFENGVANNNVVYGIGSFTSSSIFANTSTATGNTSGTNVFANNGATILFTGGNGAGLLSPAANTVGNGNAIIIV